MPRPESTPLTPSISGVGFFVLAFGCIVGSGWVVAMGEWIAAAGPGGAVLGFLAGGVLMALIAAAYAELLARLPQAGGEFNFISNGIGRRSGFLAGWFIILHLVSFTAFEAFALSWFVETLMPKTADFPALYKALGSPVSILNLGIGIVGLVVITWFNCRGANVAVRLQRIITFGFIALSAGLIALGLCFGDRTNLQPLFASSSPHTSFLEGMFWTFSTSLLFLSGFQTAANAIEERGDKTSMTTVAKAIVGAVIAAAIFYALILLASSLLVPWQDLVKRPLPAAAAFENILRYGLASQLILIAAITSLIKTWNALHLGAARLVMALAREGHIPRYLAQIDPVHGVPKRAVILVGFCTLLWLGLGRGAILPILNMCTICITLIMIGSLVSLWRLRDRQAEDPAFKLIGGKPVLGLTIAVAALGASVATAAPFKQADGIPLEILLIGIWGAIGLVLYRGGARRV